MDDATSIFERSVEKQVIPYTTLAWTEVVQQLSGKEELIRLALLVNAM